MKERNFCCPLHAKEESERMALDLTGDENIQFNYLSSPNDWHKTNKKVKIQKIKLFLTYFEQKLISV